MTEIEMNQNLEELYAKNISNNSFICIECKYESIDENVIQLHCRQHLVPKIIAAKDIKTEVIETNDLNMSGISEESIETKKSGKYVCDWFGCNKQFSYLKCFRSHQNEHSLQQNQIQTKLESNTAKEVPTRGDNDWEHYVQCLKTDGKDKLFCKWPDCQFGHNLRVVVKQHIINSHLTQKRIRSRPKIHNEYEYWDKILFDKKGIRLSSDPKPKATVSPTKSLANSSPQKTISSPKKVVKQNSSQPKIENEIFAKKHLNIDKNKRDVLLSCKGLASMSKVSKYFIKKVVSGEKTYFCKWNGCQFRTKKSQKIAEHINLSHIGVDFKCNKPNCNKVFKNPHSYREHQKNHICGFGSFGYGSKGVIGVCRNENLFKYRERIVIKGKKYYRCVCCKAITKYFTGMKRHIHSQHICPFRMNLHLTRHQTPIAIKQEIMDLDIDFGLFGNQSFICCLKCNEFFNNKEDLRKHESMLCRFRDQPMDESLENRIAKQYSFGNGSETSNESKSKAQTNGTDHKLKLSEQIRRNVNAINESITKNLSIDRNFTELGPQSEESVEKHYIIKQFEGIDYYLCAFNDCKYVSKAKDRIEEHIQSRHLQTNGGQFSMDSFESPFFPMKIKIENEENEEFMDEDIKPSTSGLQNLQNNYSIEKYIEIKCINSEPNYFCKMNNCKYYSNDYIEIKTHVNESHVLFESMMESSFECDVHNCGKQFKTSTALNAHKVNHICGFGIKGRKSSGVCALDNIKTYRSERRIKNRLVYGCNWMSDSGMACRFLSQTKNNALSHIHNKHICPNRPQTNGTNGTTIKSPTTNGSKTKSTVPKTTTFTPGVRQSIEESLYDSSSEHSTIGQELEVLGTYGTQESLDNFAKYSEEVIVDEKVIYVCLYPNCLVTPRNRSYSSKITSKYKSYSTDFKHNMIRHIRRHCNDKPFVCGINGCEKRFSCSSQFKNHQSSH